MSDTPETDKFSERMGFRSDASGVISDTEEFARKLERERDQWKAMAEELADALDLMILKTPTAESHVRLTPLQRLVAPSLMTLNKWAKLKGQTK